MSIKPWREVAQPHKDVLEGSFKQSEFAADISQVHAGTASAEYQDPEKFFSRTFITEGMRFLLMSVAERLAGKGGDPVIQLQTAFGGGKTHTLLAVYHLASRECPLSKLAGISPILDAAGVASLPQARMAIIDGIKLSPSHARNFEGQDVNTLWGELGMQLLGPEGYAMVADADRDGTSPGKGVLTELLQKAQPCVILVDELVAYVRQFESGKAYKGGTYDSNMSFIQGLTEAMKSVPQAILLASLPESDIEVGGAQGQRALEALEKFFGRLEAVWKPVASEEAFEIVRRRLFDRIDDAGAINAVAKYFYDFYRENPAKFPNETQEARYEERIRQSFPIHPEIFDRLYEDWSTLDKFQRTRGVLQYMAMVIHRLWNGGNKDPLIMPGSLPLDDGDVRNKSIHYLPTGWDAVIEREIDGPNSEAFEIDSRDTRFGGVQAARRVARTIFLGSAPSNPRQAVRGIRVERILLGSALPGQSVGTYEDVLKRLRDRLHYLYGEQDSYWFATTANLRREMESRKSNLNETEEVLPLLRERVTRSFGRNHSLAGVHVFTPSADVPDEYGAGPRLVVLPPAAAYRRQDDTQAVRTATEILEKRGDAPRLLRNRLLFLAPDGDAVTRLKDQARTLLAWQSIVDDVQNKNMNLDLYQADQARRNMESAATALSQIIRETYRWLLCPVEEESRGRMVLRWEAVGISSAAPNLIEAIENKLREEEWVINEWSPIHLRNMLNKWFFKDGKTQVSARKVWQNTCHYLFLPRLANDVVLKDAITGGIQSQDFFGYASAAEDDTYPGFAFGRAAIVVLDEHSVLIEHETAKTHKQKLEEQAASEQPGVPPLPPGVRDVDLPDADAGSGHGDNASQPQENEPPKHFFGVATLDPVTATIDFSTMVNEVVQHFTAQSGVDVTINVEIEARTGNGFEQGVQRTVKENCGVLKFRNYEFD